MNKEEFLELLNDVINDEISASVFYKKASLELKGVNSKEVSEELYIHGEEELKHFNMLIEYCSKYNLLKDIEFKFTEEPAIKIGTVEEVMKKVQSLELQAITDYSKLLKYSKEELMDEPSCKLFKEILNDECEHFDDLAYVLGESRNLFSDEVQKHNNKKDLKADDKYPKDLDEAKEDEIVEESDDFNNNINFSKLLKK
jgi:ferritin